MAESKIGDQVVVTLPSNSNLDKHRGNKPIGYTVTLRSGLDFGMAHMDLEVGRYMHSSQGWNNFRKDCTLRFLVRIPKLPTVEAAAAGQQAGQRGAQRRSLNAVSSCLAVAPFARQSRRASAAVCEAARRCVAAASLCTAERMEVPSSWSGSASATEPRPDQSVEKWRGKVTRISYLALHSLSINLPAYTRLTGSRALKLLAHVTPGPRTRLLPLRARCACLTASVYPAVPTNTTGNQALSPLLVKMSPNGR